MSGARELREVERAVADLRADFEANRKPVPKGARFYCEETTIDIPHGRYLVRLWVANDYQEKSPVLIFTEAEALLTRSEGRGRTALALYLAKNLKDVTTVQVIESFPDGSRIGTMLYTVPL